MIMRQLSIANLLYVDNYLAETSKRPYHRRSKRRAVHVEVSADHNTAATATAAWMA
jgi:hypothetical protein